MLELLSGQGGRSDLLVTLCAYLSQHRAPAHTTYVREMSLGEPLLERSSDRACAVDFELF